MKKVVWVALLSMASACEHEAYIPAYLADEINAPVLDEAQVRESYPEFEPLPVAPLSEAEMHNEDIIFE